MPDADTAGMWATIRDVRGFFKVHDDTWQNLTVQLGCGDLHDIALRAEASDADFAKARDDSGVGPLKDPSLNLWFCVIKHKYNMITLVMQFQNTPGATPPVTPAQTGPSGGSSSNTDSSGPLLARV